MEEVETITKGNKIGKIFVDETPDSPREWDNMGKMVCFHRRYTLGDKHDLNSNDFSSFSEIKEHLYKKMKAVVVLPVYMLDHSGLTIKTTPFSCPWDSGQIGFIYATRKDILENFCKKRLTKKLIERAEEVLISEIRTYDQYLTGDVYGYVITEKTDCEHCNCSDEKELDSCWGFYGFDEVKKEMMVMM